MQAARWQQERMEAGRAPDRGAQGLRRAAHVRAQVNKYPTHTRAYKPGGRVRDAAAIVAAQFPFPPPGGARRPDPRFRLSRHAHLFARFLQDES